MASSSANVCLSLRLPLGENILPLRHQPHFLFSVFWVYVVFDRGNSVGYLTPPGRPAALPLPFPSRGTFPPVPKSPTPFISGTPLVIKRPSYLTSPACKATAFTIRCEQSTQDSGSLDVWLGRLAMVGFAVAISVEIATGKGLLENFGLTSPLPTVALAMTGLVGVLAAVFIFQSASKK